MWLPSRDAILCSYYIGSTNRLHGPQGWSTCHGHLTIVHDWLQAGRWHLLVHRQPVACTETFRRSLTLCRRQLLPTSRCTEVNELNSLLHSINNRSQHNEEWDYSCLKFAA
jgi:hypothetical protein